MPRQKEPPSRLEGVLPTVQLNLLRALGDASSLLSSLDLGVGAVGALQLPAALNRTASLG